MNRTSPSTRFAIAAVTSIVATAALAAADLAGFKAMDANGDGKVTAAEMDAAQGRMGAGKGSGGGMSSPEKIRAIDTDGDGILTTEEHAAGSRKMFEAMDTNKDGFLTQAELEAGHAKLLKK